MTSSSRASILFSFCAALVVLAVAGPVHAVTRQVGPGRMYTTVSAAIAAAEDGDLIEIDAGTYAADIATIRANDLTIRGVGGFAHLDAAGATISNGKAIWVQQGTNLTIENIEMSGASVPDQNGAGIRSEADGLTVRHCYLHDNENGILSGAGDSDIVIEDSEFADNGFGDGYSHNIYIGRGRSLTVRGSWFHHARIGHELKSRASINVLLGNRFSNEDGTASYEIDLPEGGLAVIVGNVIQQGENTDNSTIVSYAAESQSWPTQELYVVNNTIVNDRAAGGTFVRYAGTPTVVLRNNLLVGAGTPLGGTGGSVTMETNLAMATFPFVDAAAYDYHLPAGSAAIDVGTAAGMGGGMTLTPAFEYAHPASRTARMLVGGTIDVGAYEFGSVPSDVDGGVPPTGDGGVTPVVDGGGVARDGGTTPRTDGGTATPPEDDGGCGCRVAVGARPKGGSLAALVVLLAALGGRGLRRRRARYALAGGVLFVAALASGCGSDVTPMSGDLGVDGRTVRPCDGAQPVCRVMSTCGCDEVVPAIVGSTCGGGCCPWICPAWSVEERSCLDFCGVDGGRQDLGVRDSGTADAGADVDAGSSGWRACTDQGQCRLASNDCCDACGVPTLGDLDAIRIGREGAHFSEVCPTPDPACPDCVTFDAPHLVATCAAGACAGVDLQMAAFNECETDADCRVRTSSCCECGGEPRYIAIANSAEGAYAALVCPAGTGCPECAPVYPSTLMPRCGGDGHCTL